MKTLTPLPSPSAFSRVRRSITGATSLAAVLALTAACTGSSSNESKDASTWVDSSKKAVGQTDTVNWNLLLEPQRLDPHQANNYGESEVTSNLCESLQVLNPDFSISDGLASVRLEDGGKRLIYTVDAKARFWDGNPVMAEDVAFSLKRSWRPEGLATPYYSPYFSAVEAIDVSGEREVTVALKHPDAVFQAMMATAAGAIMEAKYTRANPDIGNAKTPPMCTGPYQFVSWRSGSNLTIERNDDYWRGTEPNVRKIVFSFLQGDAQQARALTGGAIQGMYQPPFTALSRLEKTGSIYYGKSLLTFYLIPTSKPGPLQDPRIREALYLATDRDAVAKKAFDGAAVPSRTLLPSDAYGAVKPSKSSGSGGSKSDIARAKKLVEEAGSPKDEILFIGDPAISDSVTQTLSALADSAKAIGLNARFKPVPFGDYVELFSGPDGWRNSKADAFGAQWNLPVADPGSLYSTWETVGNPQNYSGFADQAASDLISRAAREPAGNTRDNLLAQVDERLAKLLPWIPVVDVANVLYLDKDITGPPASFVQWYSPWAAKLGTSK